jgi:hypothetical protein
VSKYKYYFRKPKSEIVNDIFNWLLIPGKIYFELKYPFYLLEPVINAFKGHKKSKDYKNRKYYDTFYSLKKQGYIKIGKTNHQVYVELTPEGKKKAGWMQINDLKVKKNGMGNGE